MGYDLFYHYPREKFWQAVHVLATSDRSIQERLAGAALYLIRLSPEDMPEEQREEFKAVIQELTKEQPLGDEGSIEATAHKMTTEQGRTIADRILSIYTTLHGGI